MKRWICSTFCRVQADQKLGRMSDVMPVLKAEVVRHFLRLEARREEYRDRMKDILSWCELPDEQLLKRTRAFADERNDTNPALAYTVGTPKADFSSRIVLWKRGRICCSEAYTCGISPAMSRDIDAVAGNVCEFASRFATNYVEFRDARLPQGEAAVIIAVAQTKQGKNGKYELIDGVHRLVALCRCGVEAVEGYIGS
jgi:hypothetical protein